MTRLAVFDLDGTLVDGDSHVLLLRALLADPAVPRAVRAGIVATGVGYPLGLVPHSALKAAAARAFAGRALGEVRGYARGFVERSVLGRLRPSVVERARRERGDGRALVLLSASFEPVVEAVGEALGADRVVAARLATRDGIVTGLLEGEVPYGQAKARALDALARELSADLAGSSGYGDHGDDVHFLERLGAPHAVAPDARLRRHARRRSWPILEG